MYNTLRFSYAFQFSISLRFSGNDGLTLKLMLTCSKTESYEVK
ncbi:hypothetical protein [Pedobacter xixiisoli]|nr:hypothetical protein [Pedobacter xixiisoli]